ncbi:helix-turn-helix domain-containing protein [Paenibacillus chartarius]|uniref:Helix-turn-helix domain-containing protein n=1 Tax=Paenibacillus chartarius TaxID=747481 RepID=A0ABV6DJ61_9BACL
MDGLHFTIPPMPQLLTVGHSVWRPGDQHVHRIFPVFDMLLVVRGMLYMTEDGHAFELGPGHFLTLEPNRPHYGHKPCEEETDIYWLHFTHSSGVRLVRSEQVSWGALQRSGTDFDTTPAERSLIIPKYTVLDPSPLLPVLREMVELHRSLRLQDEAMLHALSARFLAQLQTAAAGTAKLSGSRLLSERAAAYLRSRQFEPYRAKELEEALHFDIDYITRCLKKHTGLTPLQYDLHVKLEEAKRLLSQTDEPVAVIAGRVGIPDDNYFVRLFRAKLGLTPGAYRKRQRGFI